MRSNSNPHWIRSKSGPWLVFLGALGLALGVVACATTKRVAVAPPTIPGATFVGSSACVDCHEEITTAFKNAAHSRLVAKGDNAKEIGCESCHGPGSTHSESGGVRGTILNPGKSPDTCFQCHLDKRAEFSLPHRHPVMEGKLSCGDCHDSHKGSAIRDGGTAMLSESEGCIRCHNAQQGPYAFEHEAMREGCTTCHRAHGSMNSKMLTQRNANLCFKCHFQQQTGSGIVIGGINHGAYLPRGTCWSAGCHEAVHGSQVSSHLRF